MKLFVWITVSVVYCYSQRMLEFMGAVSIGSGLDKPVNVAVSPDGESVYTTSSWDNKLLVFDRDTSSGSIVSADYFDYRNPGRTGLSGALGVVVSYDNKNVYVSGSSKGSLVVFNRDISAEHHPLTYSDEFLNGKNGIDNFASVNAVAVSRDNKNVYAAAAESSSIVMFNRDTTTGALEYAGYLKDGQNGTEGLFGIFTIAVSPDDRNIYSVSYAESSLVVLDRDTSTGTLTFNACFRDGRNSVDGLGNVSSVAVSPDNKNVYAVCWFSDGVSIFSRNLLTGSLTYKKCIKKIQGDSIPDNLHKLTDVEVSRDNNYVYVISGKTQNAVLVFNRNVSTGDLTYSFSMKQDHDNVHGMIGARRVAVSPEDKNVYAVSDYNHAIASFRRIEPVSAKRPSFNSTSRRRAGVYVTPDGRLHGLPSVATTSGIPDHSLFDIRGRLAGKPLAFRINAGGTTVTADLSAIPGGTYLLRFVNGSETWTVPLIVAR